MSLLKFKKLGIETYKPGKSKLSRLKNIIKLSANESALGVSPKVKKEINKKINIFKTHQLNCNINNFEFTNKNNTIGTIYIVRDPRNIAVSISNHYSLSFEESKKFLVTPRLIGTKPNDDKDNNVVNLIST